MDNKQLGTLIGGVVLLLIAVWVAFLMPSTDPTAKYLGGGLLAVLGVAVLVSGFMKKKK